MPKNGAKIEFYSQVHNYSNHKIDFIRFFG